MNLSITPISNKNINFGQIPKPRSRQTMKVFRDIPHLTCACCGREMITPLEIEKAFKRVSLPLKSIIKKGILKNWEQATTTWELLNNFVLNYPDKSLRYILEIEENKKNLLRTLEESVFINPCGFKIKGEKSLQSRVGFLFETIKKSSNSNLKSSNQLIKRFSSFKHILKDDKLDVFEQLEIYAQKYPRKTLSQIMAMDEVYQYHSQRHYLQSLDLHQKREFHFNNIEKIIKKASLENIEEFNKLKIYSQRFYQKGDEDAYKLKLREAYEAKLDELGLEKIKDKVLKEVDQIPLTSKQKDFFFKRAHEDKLDDYHIIMGLLNPYMSTFEHVNASSLGGADHVNNGIVLCSVCNSKRGNKSYADWIHYHPRLPYNTQKQILKISQLILDGKFDDSLNFYPVKIAKTLYKVSEGKIKLDISEYSKKATKMAEKRVAEKENIVVGLEEEATQMNDEVVALSKQLVELLERKEALEKNMHNKKVEIETLKSEIVDDVALKSMLEKYSKK